LKGSREVIARIAGAALRGILVALLIAMPSLLLPGPATEAPELVALMALLGGLLTFAEYFSSFPSLIEFREAPPLNRMRFISLMLTICLLSLLASHPVSPTALTALVDGLGFRLGALLDFPYSPVRLATLMLPQDMPLEQVIQLRSAAGLAYGIALAATFGFLAAIRLRNWPVSNGAFNVWINLPLFDPTTGGDVVARLQRDGRVNVILGVLLPFLLPALGLLGSELIPVAMLADPLTLVWVVSGAAFLPASLLMRGTAMLRVAELIEEKRRRAYANAEAMQTA
jgi:hypothetical protein